MRMILLGKEGLNKRSIYDGGFNTFLARSMFRAVEAACSSFHRTF